MAKSLLLFFTALVLPTQAAVGVRVVLGLTDKTPTTWDGSASAAGARIARIDPWRFDGGDSIEGAASWRLSTHPIRLFGGGRLGRPPIVANGVVLWLEQETDLASVSIRTAQGDFSFRLSEIPYGKRVLALSGRAMVDRIPPVARLTDSPEEQDYPAAAADRQGGLWLAYLEFKHSPQHDNLRANLKEAPADFAPWKTPAGGDQVWLRRYSKGAWGDPIAITPAGGDLYRVAVAVDGSGRPWVFWSAHQTGNFDLWARAVDNGRPAPPVRISNAPGTDMDPVAATDTRGRVWVAWQGWRDGRAAIFASSQNGNRFTPPVPLSSSPANEWNPAIAADSAGRVTVAWDSYRNGNYDIYARTATAPGKWDVERLLASSPRYEAYPSIAYDPQGRLWLAYEEGSEGWGKDWGADESTGIALYQGRAIRMAGFESSGQRIEPEAGFAALLPGVPAQRVDAAPGQNELTEWLTPRPENARNRDKSRPTTPMPGPKNSLPRLTFDSSGRMWLAFRSAHPVWWNPIGTVWTEYVVSCAGAACTGPVFLAHSDNLLDNRPALVSLKPGELAIIGSSDSRRQFHLSERGERRIMLGGPMLARDPFQNDLFVNWLSLEPARAPLAARQAAAPPAPASPNQAELAQAAANRGYRIQTPSGPLRLIRGEFHRHSEISMDGGNDGTILDQWRYVLDPARMDWVGCCDHDNGGGREYSWWITQKQTDLFYSPGRFSPMFSYERSVAYPEGHRNTVFAQRGVRPLPRLPKAAESDPGRAPDTLMFYAYLRQFNGIVASHTSGTNMGTDWRDNDPLTEPVVEIYQGERQNYEMPGAPRSNNQQDSIGGWRPKGFVNLALERGYQLGFQASSDHISTHQSYCNLYVRDLTREAVLEAFQKRHVYGATDDILADVRCGDHMMGDAFSTSTPPELRVKLVGAAPFAKVHIVRNNKYVYTTEPNHTKVEFTWRDREPERGKTSYYYVRGEQQDGEIVWVSPMWITF